MEVSPSPSKDSTPAPEPEQPGGQVRRRLFLLSFLMLFTELALIRWTGENIVYLSFFANFVLLGSFLGIGLGFLRGRSKGDGFKWAPVGLAALVLMVGLFPIEIDRTGSELIYFGSYLPTGPPIWVILPLVFVAVAAVMAQIAEGVARTFTLFPPLDAYRLDIAGSIAGSLAFAGLSFLSAPPIVWGAVVALLFASLLRRIRWYHLAALSATLAVLFAQSFTSGDVWSPYYRITVTGSGNTHYLEVNGILHQAAMPTEDRRDSEPFYFVPYNILQRNRDWSDTLVIGSGVGTDVAVLLERGASHVDAVEIDPQIYELGRRLNPERPYQDVRIDVHVDDGRAFMQQTDRRYDLILFALTDSLTLVSGQSSLRLESYLFTKEALEQASELLKPDGALVMYNYFREPWLVDRLAATLAASFEVPPCVRTIGESSGLAVLLASDDPTAYACPAGTWASSATTPSPVSDDHPFVYLRSPGIPGLYLLTIVLIVAVSILFVRVAAGRLSTMRSYLDLFFMGAAFLLLETKNVVQFALLFGTTWLVNALVFVGILLAVLGAVEVARTFTLPRPVVLYGALFVSLGVAFIVPQHALLLLNAPVRFAAATVLAFAPIFLANLVFAQRFRDVGSSVVAFGANLLGAMIGGVLEYTSLMTGYRALLALAGALYAAAFVAGRRHLSSPAFVPEQGEPSPVK